MIMKRFVLGIFFRLNVLILYVICAFLPQFPKGPRVPSGGVIWEHDLADKIARNFWVVIQVFIGVNAVVGISDIPKM